MVLIEEYIYSDAGAPIPPLLEGEEEERAKKMVGRVVRWSIGLFEMLTLRPLF